MVLSALTGRRFRGNVNFIVQFNYERRYMFMSAIGFGGGSNRVSSQSKPVRDTRFAGNDEHKSISGGNGDTFTRRPSQDKAETAAHPRSGMSHQIAQFKENMIERFKKNKVAGKKALHIAKSYFLELTRIAMFFRTSEDNLVLEQHMKKQGQDQGKHAAKQ
jgi:hypothetical protein